MKRDRLSHAKDALLKAACWWMKRGTASDWDRLEKAYKEFKKVSE